MTAFPLQLVTSFALLVSSALAQLQFAELPKRHLPPDNDPTVAVAVGDVDGDGDIDIVFGGYPQNRLYLNDGTGAFADVTAARMPLVSHNPMATALGDVDRDGDLDLVWGNDGQQNQLYLNNSTGTFTDATAARMPPDFDNTRAVVLGDVDGDGDLDIVFGNNNIGIEQIRLYLNDGTGTFTDATAARMPVTRDVTDAVAFADVDGDGDQDLLLATSPNLNPPSSGQNRLYLNDGAGIFTDASAARMPIDNDYARAVAVGDVDGDGDIDIVFGAFQHNKLYLNDGTGAFANVSRARMPVDILVTTAVALGDVDADSDVDIVFGNVAASYCCEPLNRLYLNDGTGTFTNESAARMPVDSDGTNAVAFADVDADGDADLVVANGPPWPPPRIPTGTGQDRLYLNLLRQLDVPLPVRPGYTYQLDVYARYGSPRLIDVAMVMLSTGTARIPLPPYGTFGLNPRLMVALPPFVIPQSSGVSTVSCSMPSAPSLVGLSIYAQALLLQMPVAISLTNWFCDQIVQ